MKRLCPLLWSCCGCWEKTHWHLRQRHVLSTVLRNGAFSPHQTEAQSVTPPVFTFQFISQTYSRYEPGPRVLGPNTSDTSHLRILKTLFPLNSQVSHTSLQVWKLSPRRIRAFPFMWLQDVLYLSSKRKWCSLNSAGFQVPNFIVTQRQLFSLKKIKLMQIWSLGGFPLSSPTKSYHNVPFQETLSQFKIPGA